jgi:hypothetical protein
VFKKLVVILICLGILSLGILTLSGFFSDSQPQTNDSILLPSDVSPRYSGTPLTPAVAAGSAKPSSDTKASAENDKNEGNQIINEVSLHENDSISQLVSSISSVEGISKDAASALTARKDFYEIINAFEKNNADSFETENNFRDRIVEVIRENSFKMSLYAFNCNDTVCAAAITYENSTDIDSLIKKSLIENTAPVGIVTQPVIFNGNKELRLIFNYSTPVIILSKQDVSG